MPHVALFPLRSVLVPGLVLPLHIFEPRYRLMIQELRERPADERGFAVVGVRPGADACRADPSSFFEVGTMARITSLEQLADGRYDLVTVGARRFGLRTLDHSKPYMQAEIDLLDEPLGDPVRTAQSAAVAARLLTTYRRLLAEGGAIQAGDDSLPSDPVALSYLVATALVIELPERQRLLEIPDAQHRLAAACDILRREIALVTALPSTPALDLLPARTSTN